MYLTAGGAYCLQPTMATRFASPVMNLLARPLQSGIPFAAPHRASLQN